MDPIEWLTERVAAAGHVFVLSGAGLSTGSGIPDFRGPDGLYTRHPAAARMFDLDAYVREPAVRVAAWRFRMDGGIVGAQPNAGHRAIAAWQAPHRRVSVATQNIDGLHQRGGSRDVLELHGTFWATRCLSCGDRRPIDEAFDRVRDGEEDPDCRQCGGIIRTATVAFGQSLDPGVLAAAVTAARSADLAVAVGSSLEVQPAASLCSVAVEAGVPLAVVNAEPTPYDAMATMVVRGDIPLKLARVTVS